MKRHDAISNEMNGRFIIVDEGIVKQLIETQKQILDFLQNKDPSSQIIGKYISETEAKKLLNRKTTWFWKIRTEGKIAFTKVGNQIFYKIADLEKLLDKNLRETI